MATNFSLPKWPQMKVRGHAISKKRALEIIRRTDSFIVNGYGGNDDEYDRCVRELLGIPKEPVWRRNDKNRYFEETEAWRKETEAWRKAWGILSTEYVKNAWISTAFVGGPHGWCHPDGQIYFDDNVGKWPDVFDILEDWRKIAGDFPFLDLGVTLMSAESDENGEPVVSIVVKKGQAELEDPDVTSRYPQPPVEFLSTEERIYKRMSGGWSCEHGLPWEVIEGWAKKAANQKRRIKR